MGAAGETGQFLPPLGPIQPPYMGKGAAIGDTLLHGEMGIGHGGQLGQMGDAQHLLGAADAGHLLRHLLSGPAGDAGIHLVKDHGAYPVLLR